MGQDRSLLRQRGTAIGTISRRTRSYGQVDVSGVTMVLVYA